MRNIYGQQVKPVLDCLIAGLTVLALSPIFGLIAFLVRVRMGSPVIFRQLRPGLHGRPFTLFKFRTMTETRDSAFRLLPDKARVRKFGSILRNTSLDELPELVNVLKGEMSLVGPRPLLMHYLERYSPDQQRRHEVKPGITGWAQVNGRNAISWEEKFALDLWYVDNLSFWLDLKILCWTVWKILKREGIRQPGHPTAKEFMGQNE
jgi:lipopolysaccharide/colanic/teichoic acid biosynthesis glycosyltransferase